MAQKDPLLMTCEDTRLNDAEAITTFLRTKHTIKGTGALAQDGSGWEGVSWGDARAPHASTSGGSGTDTLLQRPSAHFLEKQLEMFQQQMYQTPKNILLTLEVSGW